MPKLRLKIDNPIVFSFSLFYIIVGAVELIYVVIESFAVPPHIGVLGLLSLITAYGLVRMRKWSVLFAVALFFLGTTFSATTLYNSIILQTFEGAPLFHTALIVYTIVSFLTFVYVVMKREEFE